MHRFSAKLALGSVVVCTAVGALASAAAAGTSFIDGISDQSIPYWDGGFSGSYFGSFFSAAWVGHPPSHIKLARFAVPWDVMAPGSPQYPTFNAWYQDVASLGLIPDVALTSGTTIGALPSTSAQYQQYVGPLLSSFPGIRYLEAWNEPNAGGGPSAVAAAHFWNSANTLCQGICTAIAGDFLDSQSNLVSYEQTYKANLNPADGGNWGVHPYAAVKYQSETTVANFKANLPNPAGDQIWFTEVGAYYCEKGQAVRGERQQAADASWLVNRLMPDYGPVHVFYYEFLYGNRQLTPCSSDSDTALYVPSTDPNAPDAPRAAATFAYNGQDLPSAYTGAPSGVQQNQATLTGSVYPGGFLDAHYHFDYGTTTGYGASVPTPDGDAGSNLGGVSVAATAGGLQPGVTYHYRLAASNSTGTADGADSTFTTPPGAPGATTSPASGVGPTNATLNGTVNPEGADTHYHFEYGTTTAYGTSAPVPDADAGSAAGDQGVSQALSGLQPATTYHFRLVATNSVTTTDGADQAFTTPPGPPAVSSSPATSLAKTGATLNGSVNPDGLDTHYHFEYGTTTAYGTSAPVPDADVGTAPGVQSVSQSIGGLQEATTYHFRLVATNSAGTTSTPDQTFSTLGPTWAVQTTPDAVGATSDTLAGVSCTSATACMAVGSSTDSSGTAATLAEHWDGTSWTVLATPNGTGLTGSSNGSWLQSVSCTASSACTAVGYYTNSSGTPVTLAERWNGLTWTLQSTPNPPSAGAKGSRLYGVSCTSLTDCTAIGYFYDSAGNTHPIAEHWDGTAWSLATIPEPSGAVETTLNGISCTSASACTAVGNYSTTTTFGTGFTLAERWNGSSWTVQSTPNAANQPDSYLIGVSCPTASACTAVGEIRTSASGLATLAEQWNGTTWTLAATVNPGPVYDSLWGVSCTTSTACIAVGVFTDSTSVQDTLAEQWNGTSWTQQPTPNASGTTADLLTGGVSCTSALSCAAVGYDRASGVQHTFAESYS